MIELTFLGTGTSQGVPVIGCACPVCKSGDSRDHRLRTSALLRWDDLHLVLDAGPDFRQQMLRHTPPRLNAILLTHEHNDHVAGLDDVRPFNFRQHADMPVFAEAHVLSEISTRFAYAFDPAPYPGAPRFDRIPVLPSVPFGIQGHDILPFRVWHGQMPVLGYRFADLTYITDARTLDDEQVSALRGTQVLVINALRHEPHESHLHLAAAIELAGRIGARKTWLTHVSHSLGLHAEVDPVLPPGVRLAWDGLTVRTTG